VTLLCAKKKRREDLQNEEEENERKKKMRHCIYLLCLCVLNVWGLLVPPKIRT
jgi:hypothetical protein